MRNEGSFHFCPGNHDVNLNSDKPWGEYHSFVKRLSDLEKNLISRFHAYKNHSNVLDSFDKQSDLLSISPSYDNNLIFVSLNSVYVKKRAEENRLKVEGNIGDEQWACFGSWIDEISEKEGQIRVALMHHSLFLAPAWCGQKEDRSINDQALSIRKLTKKGFKLILHGHTHYASFTTHKIRGIGGIIGEQDNSREIKVVACPTLGGQPNLETGTRGYLVIKIGHYDNINKKRSIDIYSRIYKPGDQDWEEGVSILDEEISFD